MSIARVRALVLVSALVICAVVLVVLAIVRDKQGGASYGASSCPAGTVPVQTKPLPVESKIKINVYNGTTRTGLANQAADDFRSRKFTVGLVKDGSHYTGIAVLRFGPKELAAASVVNAYFLGDAELRFDIKRTDDVVDVVLGAQYKALGTPTDVKQAIAQLGNPSPPPGTCDTAH
ncbi:MAG TPA: LytR C-terminal domain-containing protein [Rugosimonospora sp.]|nr:LytR C-terminal domain-containing protein [Rugosimonospora sp.]